MKKLFILMGVIYVFALFSYKEPKENPESFAEIIKKDPSRRQELLHVADSINRLKGIDPLDMIGGQDLNEIRRFDGVIVLGKQWPIIRITMEHMSEILGSQPFNPEDSLLFFLGTYKDPVDYPTNCPTCTDRIDRYNKRNNLPKKVTIEDLEGRPTFVIKAKRKNPTTKNNIYYDVARLCPPPKGCNESGSK